MGTVMGWSFRKIRKELFLWIALVALCTGLAQGANPSQLKAAYIYNFAKFVVWPARESAGSDSILFCVYGKDPVGDALNDSVAGKVVNGQTIVVRTVDTTEDAQVCHVLYIGHAAQGRMPTLLSAFQNSPVLTVGDSPAFFAAGGMIDFVVESKQLHFAINVRAAQKAGLKISSRLLSLAIEIKQ
jgi:YfiR/HmsC-like